MLDALDGVSGRLPGIRSAVASLTANAARRCIGSEVATSIANLCHWTQNRDDNPESHEDFHYGNPCPYAVVAAILRGEPDPREGTPGSSLVADLRAEAKRIEMALRMDHRKVGHDVLGGDWCSRCVVRWPCPTIQVFGDTP